MTQGSLKRIVAAGAAALVLGGAAFGVVSAQQATPTPTTEYARAARGPEGQQQFLEALAEKLGVSVESLRQAIDEVRQEQGLPDGPGMGFGGPRHGHGHGHGGMHLESAAEAIGITPEQLRQELPGNSLTQVAEAHGADPDDVAEALKAEANERIDQAVASGRISEEQANQKRADVDTRVDELMDRVFDGAGFERPGEPGGPPSARFGPQHASNPV